VHTVVAEERDHKIVSESQEVHGVPKEIRHPVVTRNERHEQELQHVQKNPQWQEGADRHLEIGLVTPCK
jgi:hypothetical protein